MCTASTAAKYMQAQCTTPVEHYKKNDPEYHNQQYDSQRQHCSLVFEVCNPQGEQWTSFQVLYPDDECLSPLPQQQRGGSKRVKNLSYIIQQNGKYEASLINFNNWVTKTFLTSQDIIYIK